MGQMPTVECGFQLPSQKLSGVLFLKNTFNRASREENGCSQSSLFISVAPQLLPRVKGRCALRYRYALDTRSSSASPLTWAKARDCFRPLFNYLQAIPKEKTMQNLEERSHLYWI